jgi:spore germination protein GerM
LSEQQFGKVLEMLSRVLAAIDGIRRSIDELDESINSLASTIYASCFLERIGEGKVIRSGLPSTISFLVETKDKLFVVRAKVVSTYEDAVKVKEAIKNLLYIPEGKEIVPTLITSRYKSHDIPSDVNVMIC